MKSTQNELTIWEKNDSSQTKSEALETILASPIITLTKEGQDCYFYSSSQIREAYNVGKSILKRSKRKDSVYTIIRSMNIGDCLFFPIEKHGAVRTTASKLKSAFCVQYVTKVTTEHGKKEVRITRIK